ncbi:MAG: carbamate kinase [Miltoncostaeaceae bacterium]|nr:carbamate kinase [Miltoncostaeaceae bacterium]
MIAVGGNALAPEGLGDFESQFERAGEVAGSIVELVDQGYRVALVHGNGPQVGALALAQEALAPDVPPQPLFVLGAMTQGQLGYLLCQAIGNALDAAGRPRAVAAVMTQVVVSEDDPAFSKPTKPIGPFFPAGRARRLAKARGWSVGEDAGRGWRRMVPSPDPLEVVEWPQIEALLRTTDVVVACGGGGVPVTRSGTGLAGVEAVIDKDLAAARLGGLVGADRLLLLTGVERVFLGFGGPDQRPVDVLTVDEARGHLEAGEFPAGSMGPKILGAIRFVESSGGEAIITSLERVGDALAGRTGTRVVP